VAEDLAFGQAVAMGASVEPPAGQPDIPAVTAALAELDAELFVVVEQDMYPVDFDVPLPIATRTRSYLNSVGLHSRAAAGPAAQAAAVQPSAVQPEEKPDDQT
jgi:inosose dehydratase